MNLCVVVQIPIVHSKAILNQEKKTNNLQRLEEEELVSSLLLISASSASPSTDSLVSDPLVSE